MLSATIRKNDKKARQLIYVFSAVVFSAVILLGNFKLNVNLGFNVHLFATANAYINSAIAFLLIFALIAVKQKKYLVHKKIMLVALTLSILFLIFYITHHLFAGEAKYGDSNHDGILSDQELAAVGYLRTIYLVILFSHIFLAAIILPFILFTAYRGLTGEFPAHKKIARYTWPIWLYIAITGPVIYFFISPYYN